MKLSFKIFISVVFSFALVFLFNSNVKAYTPMFSYSPSTFAIEPQYDYINESELDLFFSPLITALENKGLDYIIYIKNPYSDFNGYSEYQIIIFRDKEVPVSIYYYNSSGYISMAIATCQNTQYISPNDCSYNSTLSNSKVIAPLSALLFNTTTRDEYINYINNSNFPTSKFSNMYYTTSSNSKSYTFATFSRENDLLNVIRYNFIYQSSFDIKLTNIFNPTTTFWYDKGYEIMLYGVGDIFPTYKISHISSPTLEIDSEDIFYVDENDTDFEYPSASAFDSKDGDISHLIEIDYPVLGFGADFGKMFIQYKICNSGNLCTTKKIEVVFIDFLTELVLLEHRAVMFIPKNYQTFDFDVSMYFKLFNTWTYAIYDLDTKKILEEGVANSILKFDEDDNYIYYPFNYKYYLDKNIHFGILFKRTGDIALNGVVRYNANIFNYRTYTEWNDNVDDIPYIDYDGSNGNIDTDNIDVPDLGDDDDYSNNFMTLFSSAIDNMTDIVSTIFSYISHIFGGLNVVVKYFIISAFSLGLFVIILKIIL